MRYFLLIGLMALSAPALAETIPVPPIPPDDLPLAEAAPVPNIDAKAPVTPTSDKPSVDVKLYRSKTYDPAFGFAPGSRFQDSEDRKPIQTPGIGISVPLQ